MVQILVNISMTMCNTSASQLASYLTNYKFLCILATLPAAALCIVKHSVCVCVSCVFKSYIFHDVFCDYVIALTIGHNWCIYIYTSATYNTI